jgi:hypothetical protein
MAPRAMYTYRDFVAVTGRKKSAHKLVRWLLVTGQFPEYWLAERYVVEAARDFEDLTPHNNATADPQCPADTAPAS